MGFFIHRLYFPQEGRLIASDKSQCTYVGYSLFPELNQIIPIPEDLTLLYKQDVDKKFSPKYRRQEFITILRNSTQVVGTRGFFTDYPFDGEAIVDR